MSRALHLLSDRLQEAEDRAAKNLAQAQQEEQRYLQQLDALNEYRQIYSQQMLDKGVTGLNSSQFHQYHAFINKLDQTSLAQQKGLQKARQVVRQKRDEWLELQQRRKAIGILLDKQAAKEQLKQAKQEQKQADEFALFQYMRQQHQRQQQAG